MQLVFLLQIGSSYNNANGIMDARDISKLNQQLAHLRSPLLFTLHFKPKLLLELHQSSTQTDPSQQKVLAKVIQEITTAYHKSVYVAMKVLMFMHQLLQENKTAEELESAADVLGKMKQPIFRSKYQQYHVAQLINPYRQYLVKLASIFLRRSREQFSPRRDHDGLEYQTIYCMYNLTLYSLQQFPKAIRQFSRFFTKHFPCLNQYIALIGKDLSKFLKKITLGYERNTIQSITFLEIEQMQSQLEGFTQNANRLTNSWIFPQTNAQSFQFLDEVELTQQGMANESMQGREVLKATQVNR